MKHFALLISLVLLASCAGESTGFPVDQGAQSKLTDKESRVKIVRLGPDNIGAYTTPKAQALVNALPVDSEWAYAIGPGDILSIVVYDHPELSIPTGADRSAAETGFRVQQNGSFYYPHIGKVDAAGRSIESVRSEISQKLANFITDPQVVVKVVEFNSQKVLVSGEVEHPNHLELTTVPLTLLEAVNRAGGVTDDGDLSQVRVQRNSRHYTLDLEGFLDARAPTHNPILRAGDVVHVPLEKSKEAFLLGEVKAANAIDLSDEPISLTQGVSRQGGIDTVRADARGVFVFRETGGDTTVYQLETSSPEGWLLGTRFILHPRDVVYVTQRPLQKWNDVITRLLPTIVAADTLGGINS